MVAGQTKQGNMTGAERPQTRKSRRKVRRVESYRESALAVVDRSLEDTRQGRARSAGREPAGEDVGWTETTLRKSRLSPWRCPLGFRRTGTGSPGAS